MRKQRIDGVYVWLDVTWDDVRGFRYPLLKAVDEYTLPLRWADLETEKQNALINLRRVALDLHLHSNANDAADAIVEAIPDWL